jgi:beta-glucosidase
MRIYFLILLVALTYSIQAQDNAMPPDYLNPDLSIEKRVDDLVGRLTLEEKVSQMVNDAASIPRLQIPEYDWWSEGLHGVARAGIATVFPQAIGLAATWDTDLMQQIAGTISTEARAKHHEALRNGQHGMNQGLTFWSPNINIFRDPRWGRGQETYGEDPYLTGRMGVAFVKGMQGDDPKYFKTIATPKHYAVHSGPEPERHTFDAIIDQRELYDTYLPAFEACVEEGGAFSVMCAYNRYAGEACCSSPTLLHKILREKWGFKGYIVSDCGAIDDIFMRHKLVPTAAEAAALSVKAGTDISCGRTYDALVEAVKKGLISEQEIDISVKRLFTARMKLGMFDPPERVPYAHIPISEIDTAKNRALSLQAAQESIVLLKNINNTLPLKRDLKKIAVIGPTADSYAMLLGNYNGTPSKYVTPLQGIRNKVAGATQVVYEAGCNLVKEGAVSHELTAEMVSVNGQPGLKADYFNNKKLEGEPFYTRIDALGNTNWIWGARIPGFNWREGLSIRWSGSLSVPETGDYNFIVRGNDGYRLVINGQVIVEDWTDHENPTTNNQTISLKKGESLPFKLEYFLSSGWPEISLQWELQSADPVKNAIELARQSDVIIFVGGITAELEGEEMPVPYEGFKGGDRTSLDLPKAQENLIKTMAAIGKPMVLVLTSGSALAPNWAAENLPAIVQLWYPGQEGGTALADVLFGDYNPAGRLPLTFYKSVEQLPPFEDYHMPGRTYRYFDGQPLYPFGYGLSYTTFKYTNLQTPKSIKAGEDINVTVEVTNSGKTAGDEVVQLYVKDLEASVPVPIQSLQGIKRLHLLPGEKRKVDFVLKPKQISVIDNDTRYVVEPGDIEIAIGGALPGTVPTTTQAVVNKVRIDGEPYIVEKM